MLDLARAPDDRSFPVALDPLRIATEQIDQSSSHALAERLELIGRGAEVLRIRARILIRRDRHHGALQDRLLRRRSELVVDLLDNTNELPHCE